MWLKTDLKCQLLCFSLVQHPTLALVGKLNLACARLSVRVGERKKRKKRASSAKASERFFALFFHSFSPLSWSVEQAKLNSATRLLSNLPSKISWTLLFDMRRLRFAMKNYRISLTLLINSFSNMYRWGVVLAKTEPADHDLVNLDYKTPRILLVLRTRTRSNKCPGARVKTK